MLSRPSRIVSINVGRPRAFLTRGREATSAIWKTPVAGTVWARGVNLEGDDQADRTVHGGPDKAVYAYALEDTRWWERELGRELGPGTFGENLTTEGIDWAAAVIGETWRVGAGALFQVSEPRAPCWKLAMRMEDPRFVKRFTEAGRTGAYLRIVEEGPLSAGDAIAVVERPAHGVTVADVFRAYTGRGEVEKLLEAEELSRSWTDWARSQLRASTVD